MVRILAILRRLWPLFYAFYCPSGSGSEREDRDSTDRQPLLACQITGVVGARFVVGPLRPRILVCPVKQRGQSQSINIHARTDVQNLYHGSSLAWSGEAMADL